MAAIAANSTAGGCAPSGPGTAAAGGLTYAGSSVGGAGAAGEAITGTNGGMITGGGSSTIAGAGAGGTAGGGGAELGGYANACCEGTGGVTSTRWKWVGEGRGDYSQVAAYNYTGLGAGDWERTVTTQHTGWKLKPCCLVLPVGLLLLLPLCYLFFQKLDDATSNSEGPASSISIATVAPTSAPVINCLDTAGWDKGDQAYCCKKFKIGCPKVEKPAPHMNETTLKPTAEPAPELFHCFSDIANWGDWSANKKEWCCAEKHIGCNPLAPHPQPKPSRAPVTSAPYDCSADFTSCYTCLQHRWSVAKRTWCCDHVGRGCTTPAPPTKTSTPYDCEAGYTTCHHCLEKRWSISKMQWCCTNRGRGCHALPKLD